MRTKIDTMKIETAFREAEIKSAVLIGLDYGFDTMISRCVNGTMVRFREDYEESKERDIEKIIIWFYNDNKISCEKRNKITVCKVKTNTTGFYDKEEKEGRAIFETWENALPHIMHLVWSIENAQ